MRSVGANGVVGEPHREDAFDMNPERRLRVLNRQRAREYRRMLKKVRKYEKKGSSSSSDYHETLYSMAEFRKPASYDVGSDDFAGDFTNDCHCHCDPDCH
jgi:hypothetical protein